MALIRCPNCNKEASTEADRCPHCGHPIKRGFFGKTGAERWLNCGCMLVLIVLLVIALPSLLLICGGVAGAG